MKIVLDTNVLVSAFLKPDSVPARVLQRAIRGELMVAYDQRILAEYVDVLGRPQFKFHPTDTFRVLLRLITTGHRVLGEPTTVALADPDDLPFLEVAIASGAAIVTGNTRHFAGKLPARVLSPRDLLAELGPAKVVVRAQSYNVEQRFDGDWARIDDGSMLVGTIDDWERFCAQQGFELLVQKVEKELWDPYSNALANLSEMQTALQASWSPDLRALSDRDRLADDLELILKWAFPIPRRFSGLKGLLRLLHSEARRRGCSDDLAARAIASAVTRVTALGGDTVEQWDVCSVCKGDFRYPRFTRILVARMLSSGYGALCAKCGQTRPSRR